MNTTWLRLLLVRELRAFARELELFPDESLMWKTVPGLSNSAGNLALHVCGNLQHYVGAVLGESGYVRNRELEFSSRDVPRGEVLAGIERTIAVVTSTLDGLPEARLEETYPIPVGDVQPKTGLFLMHLAVHLGFHLGQAGYARRALTGETTSSGALPLAALTGA